MTREHLFALTAAMGLAAVSACGGDGGVGPQPHVGPPAVATRVAPTYTATVVPVPAGRAAVATALSDSGEVVGWAVDSVIAANLLLPTLPASYGYSSWSVTTSSAFTWSKRAGYQPLPLPTNALPATAAYVASFPTAVSAHGVIVGALAYVDTAVNQFRELPVRWAGGVAQLLPLPPGTTHARAIDVDESGSTLLVRDEANEAAWTWSADAGYSQISAGFTDYFQPVRLTTIGVAGYGDPAIAAPMVLGGSLNTTWPLPTNMECSPWAFSRGGAALGWCGLPGGHLVQMCVWQQPMRQPSLAGNPVDSLRLVVVSDGGVAAGYTARQSGRAVVAYDSASGVVPIMPRVVNPAAIAASSGFVGIPRAINAHGTLLFSIAPFAPYILEPQS